MGNVTDVYIWRVLLRELDLSTPVNSVMDENCRRSLAKSNLEEALNLIVYTPSNQICVADEKDALLDLNSRRSLSEPVHQGGMAIIMAGGEGRRLRPLTENCPKPMLRVRGKPMLEIILENCIAAGIIKFLISVNYLKEQIQVYFGNGEQWGVEIEYVEEDKHLGTGGALSLIEYRPHQPILLINGDVLTGQDFAVLTKFHREADAAITVCVKRLVMQIPYGVVSIQDNFVTGTEEKPEFVRYVNAGIYVIEPRLLDLVPKQQFFDLPDLLQILLDRQERVAAFPIHEDWYDVGDHETLGVVRRQEDE